MERVGAAAWVEMASILRVLQLFHDFRGVRLFFALCLTATIPSAQASEPSKYSKYKPTNDLVKSSLVQSKFLALLNKMA